MSAVEVGSEPSALWYEEPAQRPGRARIRARIGGLHCSLCTGTIERALGRQPGVEQVAVSLTHEQALVEFDPARVRPEQILRILRDIGYTIHDPRKLRPFEEEERLLVSEGRRFLVAVAASVIAVALIADVAHFWRTLLDAVVVIGLVGFVFLVLRAGGLGRAITGALALGALAGALLAVKQLQILPLPTAWIIAGLALLLVFGVGGHILRMAVQAVRRGILNQHVLLEAAALAGLTAGAYGLAFGGPAFPAAAFFAVSVMVATYHIFSEWLSLIVKTRSSQAVKRLLDLQPSTARVVHDGREVEMPVQEVQVGALVRIRPGESIPVDGEVVEGRSGVDQSLVTGESVPIDKTRGDSVIGGSLNGSGTLLVRVRSVGGDSFLQRVAREVEDARALKPGVLHLVDRILRVYAPAVLSIATVAAIGWLLLPWLLDHPSDPERALFAALSVLVMGYPCALGISAPLSIVRGAGAAAQRGILMRTGEAFQEFRRVDCIAFDKTGTLTDGRFAVREIVALRGDADRVLALAAAAEASSEHPLARALVDAAFERALDLPAVESFEALPGQGVVARIDGAEVLAGSPRFIAHRAASLDAAATEQLHRLEASGATVIAIAQSQRPVGLVALGDRLKDDAPAAIGALHRAGVATVLLTGDNAAVAQRIARAAGIDEVRAQLLPGQKAEAIRELQRRSRVAFAGDGINDAPALMQAHVGIAMGRGADAALEAADIIMLNNRVDAIVEARAISRWSHRKMVQNVGLALLFNGIGVPLAATGLIHPVWAMAAMATSVTAIFFNSLWGQPGLFFQALLSVGRTPATAAHTPPAAPR